MMHISQSVMPRMSREMKDRGERRERERRRRGEDGRRSRGSQCVLRDEVERLRPDASLTMSSVHVYSCNLEIA